MLLELKDFGDCDGRNIRPAVATLAEGLGVAQSTVFARLQDLKKLDLVVDEERVGFNKPRMRRLNLVRANELLGAPLGDRPAELPSFIPTNLWHELLRLDSGDDASPHLLDCFSHLQRVGESPELILAMVTHSLNLGRISLDLWLADQYQCADVHCPLCSPFRCADPRCPLCATRPEDPRRKVEVA